jgi:hypothetical protein
VGLLKKLWIVGNSWCQMEIIQIPGYSTTTSQVIDIFLLGYYSVAELFLIGKALILMAGKDSIWCINWGEV